MMASRFARYAGGLLGGLILLDLLRRWLFARARCCQRDRETQERLFDLEGKMMAEQRQHAQEKREALRKLDELRQLSSEMQVVNVAQWKLT